MRRQYAPALVVGLGLATGLVGRVAFGQAPPATATPGGPPISARVETAPLELVAPDRYQVPVLFEPDRQVALMATDDGIVQALPSRVGELVRERQELVTLDRTEALAHLKIAQAEVRERQAAMPTAGVGTGPAEVAQAQLEAAQARLELAQLAVDRCALKAPFAGLVLDYPVSPGQYVPKGTVVAVLADVARLRVLLPVHRQAAKVGDTLSLGVAGSTVPGKVEAILPLPTAYAPLRELATAWAAARVVVENPAGTAFQPGQRVQAPLVPEAPIVVVPARAIRKGSEAGAELVQIIRNEHVASIPVRSLGPLGPERIQVTGAFRAGDQAIVESSVALVDGTFIRFGGESERPLELMPPDPRSRGSMAEVVRPTPSPTATAPATAVAPIGRPDSAVPTRPGTAPGASATKPATKSAAPPPGRPGSVPF